MTRTPSTTRPTARISWYLRVGLAFLVAGVLLVVHTPTDAASPPRLFVFANADMRAHALEKRLESQLGGVDVTVYSRIRGFEAALAERPEGVLARRPVLEALGRRAELQGYRGSSSSEKYVLVSTGSPVRPSQLNGRTVGVVDILGRRNMEGFVRRLLDGSSPRLKYVTHERDLLALLQFDAVDAVVTSEKWVELFREKSEMNLKVTPLANQVGLPAVSFSNSSAESYLGGKIRSAGSGFNSVLGVTQWR